MSLLPPRQALPPAEPSCLSGWFTFCFMFWSFILLKKRYNIKVWDSVYLYNHICLQIDGDFYMLKDNLKYYSCRVLPFLWCLIYILPWSPQYLYSACIIFYLLPKRRKMFLIHAPCSARYFHTNEVDDDYNIYLTSTLTKIICRHVISTGILLFSRFYLQYSWFCKCKLPCF